LNVYFLSQQFFIEGVSFMFVRCDQGLKQAKRSFVKGHLALAAVLSASLAACGGGGGGDGSDDVDLRAAYDRINQNCMTYADVDRAVGRSPDEVPHAFLRRWRSGNQTLTATFAVLSSGGYVSNGVDWDEVPGGELERNFDPNKCE